MGVIYVPFIVMFSVWSLTGWFYLFMKELDSVGTSGFDPTYFKLHLLVFVVQMILTIVVYFFCWNDDK